MRIKNSLPQHRLIILYFVSANGPIASLSNFATTTEQIHSISSYRGTFSPGQPFFSTMWINFSLFYFTFSKHCKNTSLDESFLKRGEDLLARFKEIGMGNYFVPNEKTKHKIKAEFHSRAQILSEEFRIYQFDRIDLFFQTYLIQNDFLVYVVFFFEEKMNDWLRWKHKIAKLKNPYRFLVEQIFFQIWLF